MSDIRRYAHMWEKGPRLNVGCALHHLPGFVNIDIDPRAEPEVLVGGHQLPFVSETFTFVLMSHMLEHVRDPFPLMDEVWRVLQPGGYVLIIVPHGLSATQLGTPSHVVAYTPNTFTAFQSGRYEAYGSHGYGAYENKQVHPWDIIRIDREPTQKMMRWPAWLLTALEDHICNLFENLYCVMGKPSRSEA